MRIPANCATCGSPFEMNRSYHRFCSKACGRQGRYAANPDKYREKNRRLRLKNIEVYREKNRRRDLARKDRRSAELYKNRRLYPWIPLFRSAKARAAASGLPFSLTKEWLKNRWTGRCELTGIEFVIGEGIGGSTIYSPTIDKIIPALGYAPTNCRIVLKAVNLLKLNGTDEQMYAIAEALLANKGNMSPSPTVCIDGPSTIGVLDIT
jgi:hypothetical protein